MKTAPAKAGKSVLGAEHELPTAAVVRSSQATLARRRSQTNAGGGRPGHGGGVAEVDRKGGGFESEALAPLTQQFRKSVVSAPTLVSGGTARLCAEVAPSS